MIASEICLSGQPSSSYKTQDENSRIDLMAFLNDYEDSWIIHKVPHRLRQANERAYEPNVISIGPYHHGKEHLKEMEDVKKSFFYKIAEESQKRLEEAIKEDIARIGERYVETNGLSPENFIKMVVFDGFFIVQLFRGTPLLGQRDFVKEIAYDLLLLENQLPFFVLQKLYRIITQNEGKVEEFTDLALRFFEVLIGKTKSSPDQNIKHLLGLIHDTPRWRWTHSTGTIQEETGKMVKHRSFIRCASKLEEAGISFEKKDAEEDNCSALDIDFKGNGRKAKLRIPKLNIDKHTERMLSNLIAFEQFLPQNEPTYVLDYVKFLDQLIDTEKDVQLLCNSDIFENGLGDDKIVAGVFNLIGDNVHVSSNFHYSDIVKQVNHHYDNGWNKHFANLYRTRFSSPWTFISFLAALFLLLLTLAQTIFTLLTVGCHSCMILLIAFCVSIVVIGLFIRLCLG